MTKVAAAGSLLAAFVVPGGLVILMVIAYAKYQRSAEVRIERLMQAYR